jgi:hypothetical protein
MREQTLRHLLLLSGKSLAENSVNDELVIRIEEVCRTLIVSREKRSPYILNWVEATVEKQISLDDGLFAFHVRGDVPNRNSSDEDLRSKNWNAACEAWEKILGVSIHSTPAKLAPQFLAEASKPRVIHAIRLTFGIIALAIAFSVDQKTGISLLGLLACNESLRYGDRAIHRTTGLVLLGIAMVTATTLTPSAAPAFLGLGLLELITALLVFTYREVLILLLGMIPTLLISVLSAQVSLVGGPSRILGFILVLTWATLALPLGKSGNLRRISIPFSLALCFLCGSLSPMSLWASLLFLFVCLSPIEVRRPKLFIKTENAAVTPVTIRQSRGL